MTLTEIFSHPLWFHLGLILVHFLWQAAVIALLAWGAVCLYGLRHGTPRYNAYLVGLVLMIAAPIVTFLLLHQSHKGLAGVTAWTTPRNGPGEGTVQENGAPVVPEVAVSPGLESATPWRRIVASCQQGIHNSIPCILPVWLSGILVLSLRLLLGSVQLGVWRFHAHPLPEDLRLRTQCLARRFGYRRFMRIYQSHHVSEAMALGILRPVILLPTSWITQMDPDMLEAIVAHELSHLRRYDLWVNLAQRIMETLFFFHPAVWWLSQCLRREREYCCDQDAADLLDERVTYASALHQAGQLRLRAANAMALGFGAQSDTLLSRVRHVLGMQSHETGRPHWLAGLVSLAVMALFVASPVLAWVHQDSDISTVLVAHDTHQELSKSNTHYDYGNMLRKLTQDAQLDPTTLNEIWGSSQAALEGTPHDDRWLAIHGIASYQLQQFERAEESLTKALGAFTDYSPIRIQCLFYLAKVCRDTYQLEKAEARFEECLRLDQFRKCLADVQRSEARNSLYHYE